MYFSHYSYLQVKQPSITKLNHITNTNNNNIYLKHFMETFCTFYELSIFYVRLQNFNGIVLHDDSSYSICT